ncbi:MAG: FAD-binding oxidoreductase [Flavobacteriaceae bacterium]|nr:FAD-binding oxidoreductase [Flavobacteriaceae bacterium]
MQTDYIIVGCGLAGLSFAQILKQKQKSFVVIDNNQNKASLVAGGLYNPVMLKRFTLAWLADKQIPLAEQFYAEIEKELQISFDEKKPVRRLIHSAEEQNNWFQALDKPKVGQFLSDELIEFNHDQITCEYGLGEVHNSGRLKTQTLISGFIKNLEAHDRYLDQSFDHDQMIIEQDVIRYKNITAKNIVFCEGFGMLKNPFFNYLPLAGNKGELLLIETSVLNIDFILKSNMFFIPLGGQHYLVGATYNREDLSPKPSEKGKSEIEKFLKRMLGDDYKVIEQRAGIRPTVKDRRPLVGTHPKHPKLALLNGMGSRGVLIAPYTAQILFDHLEFGKVIPEEMNLKRFN